MELNSAQIAQFDDQRYLLLRGAPADADLDPVIAEYEQHIDRRAQALLAEGKISGLYADEPCTAGSRRSVANATRSTRTSTSSTSAAGPPSSFCTATVCWRSSRGS